MMADHCCHGPCGRRLVATDLPLDIKSLRRLVAGTYSRRRIDGDENDTNSFTAAFTHELRDGRTTSLPSHPHPLFVLPQRC